MLKSLLCYFVYVLYRFYCLRSFVWNVPRGLPWSVSNSYILFPWTFTTLHLTNFLQNLALTPFLKSLRTKLCLYISCPGTNFTVRARAFYGLALFSYALCILAFNFCRIIARPSFLLTISSWPSFWPNKAKYGLHQLQNGLNCVANIQFRIIANPIHGGQCPGRNGLLLKRFGWPVPMHLIAVSSMLF